MIRRYQWLQSLVLAGGTIFAWTTVVGDYTRFFAAGGHLFQFSGCPVPNPLGTPCFYGALGFALALGWALRLPSFDRLRQEQSQRRLIWFLTAGSAFAWVSVGREALRLAAHRPPSGFGCAAPAGVTTPFGTPCFVGACLFLAALLVGLALRNVQRKALLAG
jgi:hypothetical protein